MSIINQLAPGLPPLPPRFRHLPIDHRGYPVPKFCWQRPDGTYDFRVIRPGWPDKCVQQKVCWLCGEPLGKFKCFVIGPMCAVNRNSAEPPSHRECAEYAVRACPFMRFPNRRRDDEDLPEDGKKPGGDEAMIMRNPGVALIWVTTSYKPYISQDRGHRSILFRFGDPVEVHWYAQGRKATRDEILASINSGLPLLRKIAERDGRDALAQFERQIQEAMRLVPA